MTRTETDVRRDLQDAEETLSRLDERRERLQGHVDCLRRELQDTEGAASNRYVAHR